MRLMSAGPAEVHQAIASMGRTEDVAWSPDGRRLALAAITLDRLLVVGVDCRTVEGGKTLFLTDAVEIASDSLQRPHGVSWIGNDRLAVANREGMVSIFDVPAPDGLTSVHHLQAMAVISKRETELVSTPGSLCARDLGAGLVELWVCNGFSNYVTHHLLDARAGLAHLDAQVFMQQGLDLPDGVAVDARGDWVAISNHDQHAVALYRNDEWLAAGRAPAAQLEGVTYPHGLCFLAGGRILLVADAGAPHFAVFLRPAQGWVGGASPDDVVRVLEDGAFQQGHYNPREGGPKGIDVHEPWGVVVTTCAAQPLAFFDADPLVARAQPAAAGSRPPTDPARTTILRLARGVAAREAAVTAAVRKELEQMRSSWSWRVTAPLRALAARWMRRYAGRGKP